LKLRIDEYGSWINGEMDRVLRRTRSKAGKLVDEAARSVREALEFFEGLARKTEKDMNSKKDAASYRAARVMNHAALEAGAVLREVQVPGEASWESLRVLKDGLSSASRSIRSFRDAASRDLSGFYLLDQRSFGGVLDRISRSGERLSGFLEGEGSYLQRARVMSGIVESIAGVRRELREKLDESESIDREREQVRAVVKDLTSQVDQLTATGDLREVLEIERELRKEGRDFRSGTLAHLKRPLRRLRDMSLRGDFAMGSEERDALAAFIQSPYKSFLSNSTGQFLARILENMKKALDSGKMEFKPRKAGRISTQLNQLIGTSHLSERQEKGRRLLARRRELLRKPDSKGMYQRRREILVRIDETRKREEEVAERSRSVNAMSEALNKRLSELLIMAEAKTREYVGREVELERPSLSARSPVAVTVPR
jgi:hypothetical protein